MADKRYCYEVLFLKQKKGDNKINKKHLYIPQGIKLKPELFTGFSSKELRDALLMMGILSSLVLLVFMVSRNVSASIVMIVTSAFASVLFTTKDQNNISVLMQVKYILRYLISQKYYPYTYQSIYEGLEEEDEKEYKNQYAKHTI